MDISPEDVGRLAKLLPFAIAVLVAIYTRLKSKNVKPGAPPRMARSARLDPRPPQSSDSSSFAGGKPIEPR